MGIGTGSGEGRAVSASRHAITSPLLEASIEGARGILLNIAGGRDLTLFEVNEAAAIIHDAAHPDANIIFGNVIDESLGDQVRVDGHRGWFRPFRGPGRGGAAATGAGRRAPAPSRRQARSRAPGAAPGEAGGRQGQPRPAPTRSDPVLADLPGSPASTALPEVFFLGGAGRGARRLRRRRRSRSRRRLRRPIVPEVDRPRLTPAGFEAAGAEPVSVILSRERPPTAC